MFKYLTVAIALAKVLEPIVNDFNAALAEGKSSDSVTVKAEKILADFDDAIKQVLGAL